MCPLGIINELSHDHNIYLGSISACALEQSNAQAKEGYLRISFTEPKQVSPKILNQI